MDNSKIEGKTEDKKHLEGTVDHHNGGDDASMEGKERKDGESSDSFIKNDKEEENKNKEDTVKEVMEQLKKLGDVFLRPFGLSTSNFELVKQSEGGGYGVQMKKSEGGEK